jgi:hypothetical protein
MDDGTVVLGNLEMTARRPSLTANSEARAVRGQAVLTATTAGRVGRKRTPTLTSPRGPCLSMLRAMVGGAVHDGRDRVLALGEDRC